MASEAKESTLKSSSSQASSLGHLMEDTMTLADAGEGANNAAVENTNVVEKAPQVAVGEKRPPPKAGLFDAPVAGSKRQKQSRYIVVDGHAVLRDNNYGITQGYISIYDGGEFQTGAEAAGGGGTADDSKDFYINAAGEVVHAATEAAKAAKPKKERKKRNKSTQNEKNPLAAAHRAALKEDQEMSEVKRLAFVGQNMALFEVFLTKGYAHKAAEAATEISGGRVVRKMSIDEPERPADELKGGGTDGEDESSATTKERAREVEAKRAAALAAARLPIKQYRRTEQPSCISSVELRDYQIEGVNFMLQMYHRGMSCILADEMGLGKTLQTITFLGTLKVELKCKGPHLVVVPMSVLSNWMSEFKRFCPALNVVRYHSSDLSEKNRLRAEVLAGVPSGKVDVVVTTYEMVVSEGKNTGILSTRYRMLILDEAHKVKNDSTQVSNACRRITKECCIFLTGTPVQNNLKECWSLLNCMQPDVFSKSDLFDDAFDPSDMTATNLNLVDSVHKILQLLVLRRKKSQVDLALPPKKEFRLLCPLSKQQTFWYKRILLMNAHMLLTSGSDGQGSGNGKEREGDARAAAASGAEGDVAAAAPNVAAASSSETAPSSSSAPSSGTAKKGRGRPPKAGAKSEEAGPSTFKLSNLMMQLRKISNHPFLLPGVERTDKETRAVDLSSSSGKLKMLDRLLQNLKEEGHRAVIFSQFTSMLDIIEDFIAMKGYTYVRLDGSTNRIQRMINIGRYNAPSSTLFIFLLSTRAGGLGVNLQTADTCILYDSDWNPQSDLQAMGRVHRIGQKKPVTIYRMVSSGTVEERIVARATRKLLLDEMISKGSGRVLESSSSSGMVTSASLGSLPAEETDQDEEVQASEMVKALKFTMMRMFKQSGGKTINMMDDSEGDAMSNKAMDAAILRARGIDPSTMQPHLASTAGGAGVGALLPGTSVEEEEEEEDFDSKMFSLVNEECKTNEFEGQDFSITSLYRGKSLKDIRNEWNEKQTTVSKKREKGSRLVEVDGGVGVGKVKVLKENMYDLADGEPSVLKKEAKPAKPAAPKQRVGGRARAGIDYQNIKHCQACGMQGPPKDMVNCDGCPMAFHFQCLGYSTISEFRQKELKSGPGGKSFYCKHHTCHGCKKSTAQAGNLLLRCLGCPLAFCEDCADWEGQMAIVPEQPPHLLRHVGFLQCNQAVYCYCTPLCQQVAHETDALVLGKTHPAVKAVEKRKKLDAELAVALATGQDPALLRQQEKAKKAAHQWASQMGLAENVYAKPKPKSYVSYAGAAGAAPSPGATTYPNPAPTKPKAPKTSKPKAPKLSKPPPVAHGVIRGVPGAEGGLKFTIFGVPVPPPVLTLSLNKAAIGAGGKSPAVAIGSTAPYAATAGATSAAPLHMLPHAPAPVNSLAATPVSGLASLGNTSDPVVGGGGGEGQPPLSLKLSTSSLATTLLKMGEGAAQGAASSNVSGIKGLEMGGNS